MFLLLQIYAVIWLILTDHISRICHSEQYYAVELRRSGDCEKGQEISFQHHSQFLPDFLFIYSLDHSSYKKIAFAFRINTG